MDIDDNKSFQSNPLILFQWISYHLDNVFDLLLKALYVLLSIIILESLLYFFCPENLRCS